MTELEARVKYLERDVLLEQRKSRALEAKVAQQDIALYHLGMALEAIRAIVFSGESPTEH